MVLNAYLIGFDREHTLLCVFREIKKLILFKSVFFIIFTSGLAKGTESNYWPKAYVPVGNKD